jgi:trehalose/maltose hydrolase-like predicted phosphorylase
VESRPGSKAGLQRFSLAGAQTPRPLEANDFVIGYEGFDAAEEGHREALTSSGNGYLCTRGAAEWQDADAVHYPGTYMHGVYDRATTMIGGQPVVNEDLVNLPNWLMLKLRIEGEEAIDLAAVELLDYRHELDMRSGVVSREVRFRDRAQRETALRSRRFVSMADPHLGAVEWTLTTENWSGQVQVVSAIDGRVTNRGVPRYLEFEARHLLPVASRMFGSDVIALKVATRQSDICVSQAARTQVYGHHASLTMRRAVDRVEDYIQDVLTFEVREGEPARIEKVVAFSMSRDAATSDTLARAGRRARRAPEWGEELARHTSAWHELWRACDLRVGGDERVQALLRLNASHVLQVCSRHRRPRRRCASPRPERRGVPRSRVLG